MNAVYCWTVILIYRFKRHNIPVLEHNKCDGIFSQTHYNTHFGTFILGRGNIIKESTQSERTYEKEFRIQSKRSGLTFTLFFSCCFIPSSIILRRNIQSKKYILQYITCNHLKNEGLNRITKIEIRCINMSYFLNL